MTNIIAGRFDTQAEADRLLEALGGAGFRRDEITSFYLSPPGQHDILPGGGDTYHSEGSQEAGKTGAAGAVIGGAAGLAVGAAAAAAVAPGFAAAAAVAGAGVGAYTGSLAGGLKGTRASDPAQAHVDAPAQRPDGIMVAVCVERAGSEREAVQLFRQHGAVDIERASGEWRGGTWADFDPRRQPQLVDTDSGYPRGTPPPRS